MSHPVFMVTMVNTDTVNYMVTYCILRVTDKKQCACYPDEFFHISACKPQL